MDPHTQGGGQGHGAYVPKKQMAWHDGDQDPPLPPRDARRCSALIFGVPMFRLGQRSPRRWAAGNWFGSCQPKALLLLPPSRRWLCTSLLTTLATALPTNQAIGG